MHSNLINSNLTYMDQSVPQNLMQYLKPLLARIQVIQNKNADLEAQIRIVMNLIPQPKDHLKTAQKTKPIIPKKTQKSDLGNRQSGKITQKKSIDNENENALQSSNMLLSKIEEIPPKAQQMPKQRVMSTASVQSGKLMEMKSMKQLPKKEDTKIKMSGISTPTSARKGIKDTKIMKKMEEKEGTKKQENPKKQEDPKKMEVKMIEKIEIPMQRLKQVQEAPEKAENGSPMSKQIIQTTQISKIQMKQTKIDIKVEQVAKASKSISTTQKAITNKVAKVKEQPKRKVANEKVQINKKQVKNLKQNNKSASNIILKTQDNKEQTIKHQLRQTQENDLVCNEVLQFKKQNLD